MRQPLAVRMVWGEEWCPVPGVPVRSAHEARVHIVPQTPVAEIFLSQLALGTYKLPFLGFDPRPDKVTRDGGTTWEYALRLPGKTSVEFVQDTVLPALCRLFRVAERNNWLTMPVFAG